MRHAYRVTVVFSLWLLVTGCGTSNNAPLDTAGSSGKETPEPANANLVSISVDGKASDWQNVQPVWEEGGAAGAGDFPDSIDVQQVYFCNDEAFLHVFLRVSPTIQTHFDDTAVGGELCDIFLDTDDDSATGCKDVDGFGYGKINGYDFKLWVPVGVSSSSDGIQPLVSYDLRRPDASGQFMHESVAASRSLEPDALIQHDTEGVEMSIPLKSLDVKAGSTIRLLFKESADPFDKKRYTEGTYVVQ